MAVNTIDTQTPGPWFTVRRDAEHVLIANVLDRSWSNVEHYIGKVRANNAQLIESAPLLLAALQDIRALLITQREAQALDLAESALEEAGVHVHGHAAGSFHVMLARQCSLRAGRWAARGVK